MERSKLFTGLFRTNTVGDKSVETGSAEIKNEDRRTYPEYGFNLASRLGGTVPGLRVCLQKIYHDFRQEIKEDTARQDELKRPYRLKIEERKGDIARLEKRIERVQNEDIPKTKEKIVQLKEDISNVRKNPHEITGDKTNKASFIIGVLILVFLTLYLFVFYSSASYSAFFKEFKGNETGIAASIFDPKAVENALRDGVTELTLILTIPVVFIGMGFLIHKFKESKQYVKFISMIFITFVFDSILAYEITEKIYSLSKTNSFQDIPDYSISLAMRSINFWLIIFAGFLVYLVWGFIFDFAMEAYSKIDKLGIAIREKEKQIKDSAAELGDLNTQIEKMMHAVGEHNTEINKLNKLLEGSIIPKDFELHVFSFMEGWMSWMKQSGKDHDALEQANVVVHEFVKITAFEIEEVK
jgi:peptidoglycan hydrolase CwlO-like protein